MNFGMIWEVDKKHKIAKITFWDGFVMYMPHRGKWDCEAFRNYNSVVLLDQYRAGDFIHKDDIVIDAGAHVGLFSYWAAQRGAIIHAFEPYQPNIEAFRLLLGEYSLEDKVVIVGRALSDEGGRVPFWEHPENTGSGRITIEGFGTTEVEAQRLDDWVADAKLEHVDFIKIDTEGHERQVLRGATETIRQFRPVIAASAYHFPEDEKDLPRLVNDIVDGYHIVVERARGYLPCEKVMFAVPEERLGSHNPWA